jgi:AcrR family transcriptional regulator
MTDGRSLFLESFMAIVVDKEKKRRQIALSCKDLVIDRGLKDITITQIAKEAGIAKGSFYDYFENKEDLVFEIVTFLIEEYNAKMSDRLKSIDDIKEKLKVFASFYYSKDDFELRKLYKEFIAISLTTPNNQMIEFQTKCNDIYRNWLKDMIQEAIDKGELDSSVLELTDSFFVTVKGFFIIYEVTHTIDNLQEAIEDYIDTIFKVIR